MSSALPSGSSVLTSESVTSGHPDKVADLISDRILDAAVGRDSHARVAIETLVKGDTVVLAGELSLAAEAGPVTAAERERIVRETLRDLGYDDRTESFRADTVRLHDLVSEQSPEIAAGVDQAGDDATVLGAGDQGLMFGYATDETPELMPLPLVLAHRLTRGLTEARESGEAPWLRPDGKAQVSVAYDAKGPRRVETVVVSTQHRGADQVDLATVRSWITDVLVPRCLGDRAHEDLAVHANPAGSFVSGGPEADAGVTGRKIIVDTYGGASRHGGGAFSGKDATKVDRTGAYFARLVAREVVRAGLARRAEVQIAYAIGRAQPVSVRVDTFGTGDEDAARAFVLEAGRFDFSPGAMIDRLQLREPRFASTTNGGHFGRPGFAWEDES